MAWPTRTSDTVLSGDAAETLGLDLFNRDAYVMESGWTWYFTEQTTTSGTYVAAVTRRWFMPPWAASGATVKLTVDIGNDSGGTTSCRLSDGTNHGTAETTTSGSSVVTLELTVPSAWGDTVQSLEVQLQASSGTASVEAIDALNMWVVE